MPYGLTGKPLLVTVLVLFAIVLARAQLTYWLARGVANGAGRTRWAAKVSGPKVQRAVGALNKWGPPVVTVSFLTVGLQTVVQAAAGLTRMPFLRYLFAMLPGCLLWSILYATVGLAAVGGALTLAARSPWTLLAIVAVALAGAVLIIRRRRSRLPDPHAGLTRADHR